MKEEKLNYQKIAKLANVGVGTVSRYFNNGSISQKNIDKISLVVQNLNFNPNFRIVLKNVKQKTIYIIVSAFSESILNIIEGIEYQFKNDYQILLIKSSLNPREYLKKLRYILKQKPDNLILFLPEMNLILKNFISNIKFTNLIVYGELIEGINSIINQEKNSFYELTKQIILSKKYDKIFYIGKNLNDISTGKMRFDGVKKAIKKFSINFEYQLIENNFSPDILTAFQKLNIKDNQKTIIISGTHTIFQTLSLVKTQNLEITDVGYNNYLDNFQLYEKKVFIDYFLIGITMAKIFVDDLKNQQIIWDKNLIIDKNINNKK